MLVGYQVSGTVHASYNVTPQTHHDLHSTIPCDRISSALRIRWRRNYCLRHIPRVNKSWIKNGSINWRQSQLCMRYRSTDVGSSRCHAPFRRVYFSNSKIRRISFCGCSQYYGVCQYHSDRERWKLRLRWRGNSNDYWVEGDTIWSGRG